LKLKFYQVYSIPYKFQKFKLNLNNSNDKRKIALLQWATQTVALGPAGKNGLAQLGLSARSAEAGELPRSSPARGSPADSGRPAASDRGRRCQGASPGGKDPDLGHRQRWGSPWWARDGDASRRWGIGDGRPEKRWRAPTRGSWSGGELGRRSLR
jgi:hypothetical protein